MPGQVGPSGSGGGGGDVSGTTNAIAKFTGASAVGDSRITDDGTTVVIQGTGASLTVAFAENSINVAIEANSTFILRLLGLPNADPVSEGAVYMSAGALRISAG